jgi:uncharacterized protein
MFDYWYVFPVSIIVAIFANSSGFSGSVLFQPFFNFILQVPISTSIATGIATETIGMTSGAYRYYKMNKVNTKVVLKAFPFVFIGVVVGIFVFSHIPKEFLRLLVGIVIFIISTNQLYLVFRKNDKYSKINTSNLRSITIKHFFSGVGSASTGTGIAEINQPIFEHDFGLTTKEANASAIAIEALGNWIITFFNLAVGNIDFNIFIFSASGVFLGAQIGAIISQYISDKILKLFFGISVSFIGLIYIFTFFAR